MLKRIHFTIIGGSVIGLVVLVYVFYAGICSVTFCETEIVIISHKVPVEVYVGDELRAEFTIKNKGEVTAENCVLKWSITRVSDTISKTFQLSPLEEISIELLNVKKVQYPRGGTDELTDLTRTVNLLSRAWVNCDNTESAKVQSDIVILHSRNP